VHVVAGLFAIGIGAVALYALKSSKEERAEMLGRSSVPGRITDRTLERRGTGTASSAYTYTPEFRYAYSLDGVDYTGDTRDLDWSSGSNKWMATRRMAKTPDSLPVLYDPADPAKSALAPPGRTDVWIWAVIGVALIAVGLFLPIS
jgi:hypothetical protein